MYLENADANTVWEYQRGNQKSQFEKTDNAMAIQNKEENKQWFRNHYTEN